MELHYSLLRKGVGQLPSQSLCIQQLDGQVCRSVPTSPEGRTTKTKVVEVLRSLHNDESGQDLIEYALVAALIAFGAVTTMGTLATDINTAFSLIGSQLSVAV